MNSEVNKCRLTGRGEESPTGYPAPTDERLTDNQHADHWVLCADERAKGFIRPVRTKYLHTKCGTVTTQPLAIAETYAREPGFYGATFCVGCRDYFPVGEAGEFVWDDGSSEKVGT